MFIADSQVHVWEADRPDRPWAKGMRPPQRPVPYTPADLLADMDQAGVARAVLIPPSWVGDGNDTVLEAARAHPGRFAAMGRFPAAHPDRARLAATWCDDPAMLGLRMTFISDAEKALLTDPAADDVWSAAERADVPVMLYPHSHLPETARIAERHPGLRLVIDHMAALRAKDDAAYANLPDLLALARFPNVAVKVSATPHYSTQPWPYRGLHRHIRAVIDAFGPRRSFWGTDLTRLPCTYAQAIAMFTDELGFLSAGDLDQVMGRALCAFLRWRT